MHFWCFKLCNLEFPSDLMRSCTGWTLSGCWAWCCPGAGGGRWTNRLAGKTDEDIMKDIFGKTSGFIQCLCLLHRWQRSLTCWWLLQRQVLWGMFWTIIFCGGGLCLDSCILLVLSFTLIILLLLDMSPFWSIGHVDIYLEMQVNN